MAAEQRFARDKLEAEGRLVPFAHCHAHPCDEPEDIRKQRDPADKGKEIENAQVCTNWGCGKDFEFDRNDPKACQHHPGRYEFGSEQGLWPEGWSCCRRAWDDMGCALGPHKGHPKTAQIKFCINHGEPNKKFSYPDGFCGKQFYVSDEGKGKSGGEGACAIHAGQFRCKRRGDKAGVWTCCQADGREAPPCAEGNHTFAEWPDEDAKKYFFDRPLKIAAELYKTVLSKDKPVGDFELWGNQCGVFRAAAPYKPVNPNIRSDCTPEEQRKLDATDRYCMHFACKATFKQ